MFRQDFLYFTLCPLPRSLGAIEKRLALSSFASFLQVFISIDKIPTEPSFLQVQHSDFQSFVIGTCPRSLHYSIGPLLDSIQYGYIFLMLESRTGPRCSPTISEQKGRIRSLSLLVKLLLVHPRIVFFAAGAHCWLVNCWILYQKRCFPTAGPQTCIVPGVLPPQVQDYAISLC